MEFTEKIIEQIKAELLPVISRFTSDVTDISIEPKKSFNGTEYLDISTNDTRMTPRVFRSLSIRGEARACRGDNDAEHISVMLSWRWETFDGGSNGAELARIWMHPRFNGDSISDIRLK